MLSLFKLIMLRSDCSIHDQASIEKVLDSYASAKLSRELSVRFPILTFLSSFLDNLCTDTAAGPAITWADRACRDAARVPTAAKRHQGTQGDHVKPIPVSD